MCEPLPYFFESRSRRLQHLEPSVSPLDTSFQSGSAKKSPAPSNVSLVFVEGALWQARPADGAPLAPGERVRVEGVDKEGLVLTVRPARA